MRVKPPSAQGRAPRVSGGLASWLEIKCHGRDVIYTWEQEANVLEKKECWRW